ncbi:MAG: hypothetical protein AAFO72_07960 [Pseudomonadota bacterium]
MHDQASLSSPGSTPASQNPSDLTAFLNMAYQDALAWQDVAAGGVSSIDEWRARQRADAAISEAMIPFAKAILAEAGYVGQREIAFCNINADGGPVRFRCPGIRPKAGMVIVADTVEITIWPTERRYTVEGP